MIGPQDPVGPHRLDPRDIDAVVFDVGGVLLYPDHAALRAQAGERGLDLELAEEVFRRAHHAACRALTDHGSVDERSAGFWAVYDRRYLDELGVPPDHASELAVALRVSWDRPHAANIAALHRLAATGMPLAIVSNNDGTAAEQLVRAGVCQVGAGALAPVAAVIDSGAVGVAKPDPAIFGLAVEVLGTEPARTLYVGDTVHADVAGARAAGLAVVQVDPYHHHADFDHHRVGDLDELLEWLGVPAAR